MKRTAPLLASALAALALLAPPPSEAASMSKPGGAVSGGGGHYSPSHGNWHGRGVYNGGGRHWGGGHRHYHSGWRPYWGFYAAAPFVFGASYYYSSWDPYYGDGFLAPRYYGFRTIQRPYRVYEEVPPPDDLGPAAEMNPAAPGAPSQGPLYMNYCPASKAYYPKVATCPEGWEFRKPSYRE